jgi:hypothetical protein
MIGAVTGMSIPNFWLGLMLMYLVGVLLGILPTSGYGGGDLAHLILFTRHSSYIRIRRWRPSSFNITRIHFGGKIHGIACSNEPISST